MSEMLDVVNDANEVIGQAERDEVHRQGLLFRLAHVCFYTADLQLVLQKRSLSKKSNPGKLDFAVTGHVASGDTYIATAIKEAREETGVTLKPADLTDLGVVRADYTEQDGAYLSNSFHGIFGYQYDGALSDLKVEAGEGDGFEFMSIHDYLLLVKADPEAFTTFVRDQPGQDAVRAIERIVT